MKNSNLILAILAAGIFSSCNVKKADNGNDVIVGTDSSMITRVDSNASMTTTTLPGDSNSAGRMAEVKNDTAMKVPMANPDPAKKGKKGKVSVAINEMNNNGKMEMDKDGFYANTEILPAFPGGQKALESFFEKNIEYPADATDNGVEGTVDLNFAVDEKGKVYAPKIVSDAIGYGIEKETLRVFSKMPVWTPGKIKGKNVKTKYTLPVKFILY